MDEQCVVWRFTGAAFDPEGRGCWRWIRAHVRGASLPLAMAILVFLSGGRAAAQPGTLITTIPLPVSGFGVSAASDCAGNIYFTNGDSNLYRMDKAGALTGTTPITDSVGGAALFMDEFSWDETRKVLWAQQHDSNPIRVYQINPTTGVATFAFTATQSISVGTFRDGLAFEAADDSIWISGDVSTTIEHYKSDGTFLNQITPKNAGGGTLGNISGVQVGVGDLLYLGQNGLVAIVQVKKSNGDFIASFASPGGGRDEGLECDSVNFAPKLALLSRDAEENSIFVIEVEPGTCACGGGVGITQRPAPAMSQGLLAVAGLLLGLLGYFGVRRSAARREPLG